jgi:hypothetical protein
MARYNYAQEKLYVAMRSLATGHGDVRARLVEAFISFHTLKEEDFPLKYREDWKWIKTQLTKHGPIYDYKGRVYKGSVENTMSKIKNSTGRKIATKIVDIGYDLLTNEKYL